MTASKNTKPLTQEKCQGILDRTNHPKIADISVNLSKLTSHLNILRMDYLSFKHSISTPQLNSESFEKWYAKLEKTFCNLAALLEEDKGYSQALLSELSILQSFQIDEKFTPLKRQKTIVKHQGRNVADSGYDTIDPRLVSDIAKKASLLHELIQTHRTLKNGVMEGFKRADSEQDEISNEDPLFMPLEKLPVFSTLKEIEDQMILEYLPNIYALHFGEKVGASKNGPGIRFLKACFDCFGIKKSQSTIFDIYRAGKDSPPKGYFYLRV